MTRQGCGHGAEEHAAEVRRELADRYPELAAALARAEILAVPGGHREHPGIPRFGATEYAEDWA